MALTLTKSPDVLSPTWNEIFYHIHSDNAYSTQGSIFESMIDPDNRETAFGTNNNQVTITFIWGSNIIILKNSTLTLDGDYFIFPGGSFYRYTLASFIQALQRNYYFSRDFSIEVLFDIEISQFYYYIKITAKNSGDEYTLSCDIDNGYSVVTPGTDKLLRDNFHIGWQVQLYNVTGNSWGDIGEVQLESVDENGDIEIDISEFLQRDVKGHFTWPQIYTGNMSPVSIIDTYRIKYMEYYGASPEFYAVNYSASALCFQGRISQLRMASIINQGLTFYQHLVNSQKPLTFSPRERIISTKQCELFYFYCPLPIASLRLYMKAYYTDGTSSADTIVTTVTAPSGSTYINAIIEVFCGYTATGVGLINPQKTVAKYQLWIADISGNKLMEIRTFIIDQRYNEYERYFIYCNKLGLYEILRTTGISYANLKTEKGFIKVPLSGDYELTERSTKQATVDKAVTITQNAGHIEDLSVINYISEFLESADVYLCDNKYTYPITVIDGSYKLYEDRIGIYSFEFDYRFALEADSTEEFLLATRKGSFNDSFNPSFL